MHSAHAHAFVAALARGCRAARTAGCIAVKKLVMRNLMKWLDPKKDPVIVIRVT